MRDPGLPTLLGRYLYADHCVGELRTVDLAAPAGDAATGLRAAEVSSFGEDACGRLLRAVAHRAGVPDRRRSAFGVRAVESARSGRASGGGRHARLHRQRAR